MEKELFADRLKAAMEKRQFKQVDLIRAASEKGVKLGKSHISQYVNGKTVPRAEILSLLAGILQVDEDWLMGNEIQEKNSGALPAPEKNEMENNSLAGGKKMCSP